MSAVPSTTADPMKAFQEKVLDKLKADIGAMMPDEMLKPLIARAVNEAFFEGRPTVDQYGNKTGTMRQSWFVQEVAKIVEPEIKGHVANWVTENRSVLQEAIKKFTSEQGLLILLMAEMRQQSHRDIAQIVGEIFNMVKRGY